MDDLRQAVRGLRAQRGFAAAAILTLALGIGVNVSVFGLLSAFFLQPLPVHDPHELVLVMQRGDALNMPFGYSYPDYRDFREATSAFSGLVASMPATAHLSTAGGRPERTWIEVVSPNYFALAGVAPAFGEFPGPDDEHAGTTPGVVLSYRYWQRRFSGDPGAVGRSMRINGNTFTVRAIAPAEFTGLSWAMAVSAFVPSGSLGALMEHGDGMLEQRGSHAWRLIGRLSPGKTVQDARAEMDLAAGRVAADYPAEHKNTQPLVLPENRARPDPAVAGFLPIVAIVFAAMVALVLLIACANVVNLMMSRASLRQRDLVIRAALGATRFRLVRQQLIESLLLAALAGVVGLLLAHWAGQALTAFIPTGDVPVVERRPTDWRVYLFTVFITAAAGLATGLWPAWKATRFDLVHELKGGGTATRSSRHVLRNSLVIAQVTMSLVVLVTAALFLDSLRQLRHVSLGFTPSPLLSLSMDLALQQYSDERGRQFLEDLVTRARALPDVGRATLSTHLPMDYNVVFAETLPDREIPGSRDDWVASAYTAIGPDFFPTTGTALKRGRAFDRRDGVRATRVAIVNETMARTLWTGEDAIGRRFRLRRNGPWVEVIGVVGDGKYVMVGERPRPYFYLPLAQEYQSPISLIVQSASGRPDALIGPVQELIGAMDADLPVFNVKTMDQHLRESVFGFMPLRIGAGMAGVQGAVALLLAVMGLYAVVAHAARQRTREIGVRVALGATRSDILRLVMRQGMRLSVIGIVLGLLIASAVGLILSVVLFGVRPVNFAVSAAVTMLVVAISAVACYLPAHRATRTDPLVALRYE